MIRVLILAAVLLGTTGPAYAVKLNGKAADDDSHRVQPRALSVKHCKHGVPCGDTCIAKGKTCHVTSRVQPRGYR